MIKFIYCLKPFFMLFRIRKYLIIFIVYSFFSLQSVAQDLISDVGVTDKWVDSVFNTLSMTEKVNQLFLVEYGAGAEAELTIDAGYGGIILNERSPGAYSEKVTEFQHQQNLRPMVFHNLDDPLGLDMDSVDHFWHSKLYKFVYEPHLFYEIGTVIGMQCKWLGIDILIDLQNDLKESIGDEHWKLSELNQGLIDQGIKGINSLEIQEFDTKTSSLLDLDQWAMILVKSGEIDSLHTTVKELIISGQLDIEILESKCKAILTYKKDLQDRVDIPSALNTSLDLWKNPRHLLLKEELAKYFVSVAVQDNGKVPIRGLEAKRIAHLIVGSENETVFNEYANKYTQVDLFEIKVTDSHYPYENLWSTLDKYDLIICTYYNLEILNKDAIIRARFLHFQDRLDESGKSLKIVFPKGVSAGVGAIFVRDNNWNTNKLVAEYVFGGVEIPLQRESTDLKSSWKIPVETEGLKRFSYTVPEVAGLDSRKLSEIDSIATNAIRERAIPGCQILIAKDTKVIYQKSFGYHTYDSLQPVRNTDLYDLASVTKVSGALPALMKLYGEGKFDLDATMGTYLPYFRRGNKKKLTYREILAHQSGLTPYIVYWKTAIRKNGKYKRKTISETRDENYLYELGPGLYLHKDYREKIYKQIRKSKVGEKKYLYSGLTFLMYPEIIETITGQDYIEYLNKNFYHPLGASTLTYNPLENHTPDQIAPTEYDSLFRKTQIHGKVHDEAAAMMAGVSSNAGLFANANDLAKLFQMYCNYGTYGNRKYLSEEALIEFTRCQYPENDNRRGLGFDRPLSEPHANGNTARSVSQKSFGHSGFTGTFAWADPEHNLVYIFLSNRVYQTRENRKLYEMNIRTDIQEVIYESMID